MQEAGGHIGWLIRILVSMPLPGLIAWGFVWSATGPRHIQFACWPVGLGIVASLSCAAILLHWDSNWKCKSGCCPNCNYPLLQPPQGALRRCAECGFIDAAFNALERRRRRFFVLFASLHAANAVLLPFGWLARAVG